MKPTPVAIVAADTHLDHLIWRSRPEIVQDSLYGFEQLVEVSNKRRLPLILAGDCWECLPINAPHVTCLGSVSKSLDKLAQPMYYISGQHDERVNTYDYFQIAKHHHNTVEDRDGSLLELGGLKIWFMSWRPGYILEEVIASAPEDADVVISHQVWSEGMGGINCEGSIKGLPGKLVISGDYHQFKAAVVTREDGSKMRFVSPGATHMRKINEPAEHYYLTLYSDATVKRTTLKSRVVIESALTNEKDFEDLYAELPRLLAEAEEMSSGLPLNLQTPLLAISDTSGLPKVESRIKDVVTDRVHLFYNRIATTPPSQLANKTAPSEQSLTEYAEIEIGDDKQVSDLILPLLTSENIRDQIEIYRNLMLRS